MFTSDVQEQFKLPKSPLDFDESVIFYNPASTGAQHVKNSVEYRLDLANGEIPPHRFLPTSEDPKQTQETFKREVNADRLTLLGIIGGDGSALQFVDFLDRDEYPNVAAWMAGGGSGGNLLHSLVSSYDRDFPDFVLQTGRIASFRPMEATIETLDGQSRTLRAATVLGFNATHNGIKRINEEGHRSSRVRDFSIGHLQLGKYLVDGPEIGRGIFMDTRRRYVGEEEDGFTDSQRLLERMYLNAPHVAEIINAPQVSLEGPIHMVDIPRRRDIFKTIIQLKKGQSPGHDLTEPHTFIATDPINFQRDGEHAYDGVNLQLPRGARVTVQPSKPLAVVRGRFTD